MAHDGSSDDESAYLDAQDPAEDDGVLPVSHVPLEVELSPSSSSPSPLKPSSPASSGRPKAVSAAAVPTRLLVNRPEAVDSNEPPHGLWDARRRTQSDSNLRGDRSALNGSNAVNSAGPAAFLASPAHSESALLAPVPHISVRTAVDTKPNGFMAMGESLLAGMADFAKINSPRGNMQKVHVVYPSPGPLFVDLYSRDDGTGARVKGFRRNSDGSKGDAEASGRVFAGDELVRINTVDVTRMVFADIITAAKDATFPLTLTFHCFQSNRQQQDKQVQQMPVERKYSSGPLPPTSPSSAGWGARLSQITRSGSFDQKNSGSDLGNGVPRSPSSHSTSSDTNGGKFGISIGKVGTDGVKKSLFRMMGNKPSRPEEDKNVVNGWMNDLALKPHNSSGGGRHRKAPANANTDVLHSTPIVAVTTGGRFVGVLDEDVNEFVLTWFRRIPPEMDIRQIKGVKRCPYFPSVDDVGAILSLQCESIRFPQLKRVVEMPQPLGLDPKVGDMVDVLLEAGAGSFSATLASNEHDSFQIKISAESVSLVKISEDEGEGGVVVHAAYSTHLQVLLDPADRLRFTLKVQEFGGFLGNREGDVCDLKKRQAQLESLSCFFLVAQNSQHRDIMTLLIRKFRARMITPEQEEQAELDEINMFMDPAFVVAVASPPPLTTTQSVGSNSGSVSSGSNSAAPGDTASSAGSPTTVSTPRLLAAEVSPTPPAVTSNRDGFTASSNGIAHDDSFVEGRLAAQDKEMAMLREKLASMAVLLKAAEQENKQVIDSLEVKDNRIEHQRMKLRQVQKVTGQCESQAREIQLLRTKLEDEERQHTHCREELQQISRKAAMRVSAMQDQGVQTEEQFLDGEGSANSAVASAGLSWERDAWSGNVATVSASDLQQQIKDQQEQISQLQDEQVKLVTERNKFRAKSLELSKELLKLIDANGNRPLEDLEVRLAERSSLQVELASAKANAKRTADEMTELKCLLDNVGDKDKGAKRLVAQNAELQRTVHQLTDSLSEARDQIDAVKKINSALASRLHRLQPETRGSIVEAPPTSPSTNLPVFSSDGEDGDSDDDDNDEEEEDEELKDGIAAFRRSLVGK